MKETIFILFIWTRGGSAPVTAVEMSSQVTCEAAARKLPEVLDLSWSRAVCLPK